MLKRLFSRYFCICATIIVLTVAVLAFIASTVLGVQSVREQSTLMEQAANKMASSFAQLPKNYNIIAGTIFDEAIDSVTEIVNGEILIYNSHALLEITTLERMEDLPSASIVESVLSGNVYRSGRSYGTDGDAVGFTVGVPVIEGDNRISGAVFLTTSELNVRSAIKGTLVIFAICGIAVLMVTFVVLFFFTKQITKPVYQMSEIANQYAQGDFSKRLDVSKCYEYAPLAHAFNSMADGIDNLEQMRRGFVTDVSHELRTPMTTITGFVDGMLDGTIPPELYPKYLSIVSEEVHRVSRMVSTFLDIARIQAGQMTYVIKPFDIVETAGKALFAFEDRINQKEINIQVDFEDDSLMTLGDSDAIYRVIYNLLDNAIKFTPEKGRIDYTVKTANGKILVTVRNTGSGISKEDAAHIFERFYKADKSRTYNTKGTGIGLYLVKNIIKEHGEDIILTSKEGEFAQFTFTLPIYEN